jgi:hypothetical protein
MSIVCLTMIVRNHALVIDHCLDSALPLIHTWVILDAGSTDGTPDIIRERLAHLPGALIQGAGLDEDTARAVALARASRLADYALLLDAEDILMCPMGYTFPPLSAEAYSMSYRITDLEPSPGCHRTNLVSTALPWHCEGRFTEPLHPGEPFRLVPLEDPRVLSADRGPRSRHASSRPGSLRAFQA